MLKLEIACESHDEARVYLNAHQYHNLLSDLMNAIRSAQKHGSDKDLLFQINHFYPDICKAVDNSMGAY